MQLKNLIFIILILLNFYTFCGNENCSICYEPSSSGTLLELKTHKDSTPQLCTNCFSKLQACPFCKCGMNKNGIVITCDGIGKSQVVENEAPHFSNTYEELVHAGIFSQDDSRFTQNYYRPQGLTMEPEEIRQAFYQLVETAVTQFRISEEQRSHRKKKERFS